MMTAALAVYQKQEEITVGYGDKKAEKSGAHYYLYSGGSVFGNLHWRYDFLFRQSETENRSEQTYFDGK